MRNHFQGNDWREHRLVHDKMKERTDVIAEYVGKSKQMETTDSRMKEVRDKQNATSVQIAETYNKRREALVQGRWNIRGMGSLDRKGQLKEKRKEMENNDLLQTVDKAMEDEAIKKVDAAIASAGGKILRFAEDSKNDILKLGKDTDRKLAICTAKAQICEAFITDSQKEVEFLEQEEAGMRQLAAMLGTETSLPALKQTAVMRDVGIALRTKIAADKAALEKKEYPDDAMPKVESVYATLTGITTRFGDNGLFGLEDDLYAAASGKKNAGVPLKNKIDGLNISKEQKDLFKVAVDKLASPELAKAAQVFLRGKLIQRAEAVKSINEIPGSQERLGMINEKGTRNMRVNIDINGIGTAFEVRATKAKGGRFIILQAANGTYASIDLSPDGGKSHLTYYKAEGLPAECVAFDTPPAVPATANADVVQLKTVAPVVVAPAPLVP